MSNKAVGFIGLGKLGTPVAVAICSRGFTVYGHDVNPDLMKKHHTWPHRELGPTLEDNFNTYYQEADLRFVSLPELMEKSDIVFIAVQTPHQPRFEGISHLPFERADFDYTYLKEACNNVAEYRRPNQAIAVVSTVLPGTMRRDILPILPGCAYNPAFPAMGTVMRDYLDPEFVLLGGGDPTAVAMLEEFYLQLLGYDKGMWIHHVNSVVIKVSTESAELAKVSYNTFVTAKTVIANTIGEIAHKTPGCNADEVHTVLHYATRRVASAAYMKAGMGDGGACFTANTLIITDQGPRRIADIEPDDRVLTIDGTFASVVRRWERQYKGEIVRVRVRGSSFVVEATTNHPFYAAVDGRLVCSKGKRITDRKISEMMGEVAKVEAGSLTKSHYISWPIVQESLPRPDHATDDYCDLAGWYLSEGSLDLKWSIKGSRTLRNGRIAIHLHRKEMNVAKRLSKIMRRLCPPKVSGRGAGAVACISIRSRNSITLRYGSATLAQRLFEDFGKGAASKRIPSWVICGSEATICAVLRGMFLGDGHNDEGEIFLSTISPNIAFGARLMLDRLGIGSNLTISPARVGKDGQGHREAYYVRVRNYVDQAKLAKILGVDVLRAEPPKKYEIAPTIGGNRMYRVSSHSNIPFEGTVYNLWVDHPSHTYVTVCGAAANCHPRDGIAMSWLAEQLRLSNNLFDHLMMAREYQTEWLVRLFTSHGEGMRKVVLGKAYKPESAITTGSAALLFANLLAADGVEFLHYDPYVDGVDNAPAYDAPAAFFIACGHEVLRDYPFPEGSIVVDPFRYIPERKGVKIIPIGVGK